MKVNEMKTIDFITIYNILTSSQISEANKTQFIRENHHKIKEIMIERITSHDFKTIMSTRAIKKFRPLKNSFTKAGDKMILAKALELPPREIPKYIKSVTEILNKVDKIDFLPSDKLEMIKTYVYRHGNKDELVSFLDFELKKSEDKIKTLYRTLEYHNCGIADYFIRPIHRMDNKTLIKIYGVFNKHIKEAFKEGKINEYQSEKVAKWALIQIYKIQNNSKLINAIKTYKTLA